MKFWFLCISLVLSGPSIWAQSLTKIDESYSYFKDGINFEHAPTQTKTRFRFRMQNRFTYESEDGENLSPEAVDFNVRRFRLRLEGTVLDERLLYRVQLSFTRGDMDWERTQYPNILRDAVVGWKFSEATTLWYGQTKLPGNRQRVISSGDQQFVDRSELNATFNIDRDLGIQLFHRMGEDQPFWIKLAVSNGGGRATPNEDSGLAYTTRVEWLPLGAFTEGGDYFEADLMRESTPKLSLGAVYSINKRAPRPGGQLGEEFPGNEQRDIETWFADALLKYRGFSWSAEFARRWTDDPIVGNQTVYKGQAFNTQMGQLFDNDIETALRFTRLWAHRDAQPGVNDRALYTLAVSKYFNLHRVKMQTDLTFNEQMNPTTGLYQSNWIYRLQMEVGF